MNRPVVCSVGCTEPWNAAGLGLDIQALAACGARAVTIVAGVTAQDSRGLHASHALSPELVTAQFAALAEAGVRAIRIGALLDVATVEAVAAHVARAELPVVYDPVLAPSAGGRFADAAVVAAILERLVPLVTLLTPNLEEAAVLGGQPLPTGAESMERAARTLRLRGAGAVLVKGGHLTSGSFDVLVDADGAVTLEGARLEGTLRGTGCLLADAIAAALAYGAPLREAVDRGRAFVRERFCGAVSVSGMRVAY